MPHPDDRDWLVEKHRRERDDRRIDLYAALVFVLVVALIAGVKTCYAARVYGDWTCAFASCVKVK